MIVCLKYIAPSVEFTRLQLEGVIADSLCPKFNNNKVLYKEYITEDLETPVNQDVIII
jgi:hypothetical protein